MAIHTKLCTPSLQVPLKQDPDDAEQPKEKGKFLIKKLAKGVEKVGRKFEKAPKSPKAEPSVTEAHANNEKVCCFDTFIDLLKKNEPPHGKTNTLHMRNQRRRSASR